MYLKVELTAVQYLDDDIYFMCPSKTINKKIKIGDVCKVKWIDKKMYDAKILKKGSKFYYTYLEIYLFI